MLIRYLTYDDELQLQQPKHACETRQIYIPCLAQCKLLKNWGKLVKHLKINSNKLLKTEQW